MREDNYWSGSIRMEMMAINLFTTDHDYCVQSQVCEENNLLYGNVSAEFMEFDVQNCVEVACDNGIESVNSVNQNRDESTSAESSQQAEYVNSIELANSNNQLIDERTVAESSPQVQCESTIVICNSQDKNKNALAERTLQIERGIETMLAECSQLVERNYDLKLSNSSSFDKEVTTVTAEYSQLIDRNIDLKLANSSSSNKEAVVLAECSQPNERDIDLELTNYRSSSKETIALAKYSQPNERNIDLELANSNESDKDEIMPAECSDQVEAEIRGNPSSLQDTLCLYIADDSGIESQDSTLTEIEDAIRINAESSTMVDEMDDCVNEVSLDNDLCTPSRTRQQSLRTYCNKRRSNETLSSTMRTISNESSQAPVKKLRIFKNREVLVSEESPIIEGDFELCRRVTRLLVKSSVGKPTKLVTPIENTPGKLVWGYFRTGWWPALIIKAEDAGMISTPGKIWVSWIGESRISELCEKHVDEFSNDLKTRLDNLGTNSKTKTTCKKQKDDACFKTIQLLKKHFSGGALFKPYVSWMKNNILPFKEKLDTLIFYPYPESLADKLDDLKRVNADKSEKYLRQIEKERLSKEAEVNPKTTTRKVDKIEKPIDEGGISIEDQKPGMIVWAKMQGYNIWPCVIMDYQHLNRKQPNVAHQWVMWYGDYKYSQVGYRLILMFSVGMEKMEAKIRAKKDELFSKAVLQASKDYCEQLGFLTEQWKLDDVIVKFYNSNDRFKLLTFEINEPNDKNIYSQTIKKQLRKQINNQPVAEERKRKILKSKTLKLALSDELPIESLCITCFQSDEELEEHPFFCASMCNQCLEEFRPKVFAYGNDGKCFYCTLCGSEELVAVCDSMNCPRVFCTACIKYIICPERYEEILLMHPWNCFLCDPTSLANNTVIRIRSDWRRRMISIYRFNCDDTTPSNLERIDRNRKIRVLSLFDGIGTGLVVLKKLNIKIDCYYASEIDPDSMQVSFFNHGNQIIQLGDVRNIDEKKIKKIAPIDLLIGGSPCNELSLANPKRRGLDDPEGSGILFYDYCRIKKLVKKYNRKHHLFWLFENVASMPKKYRTQISENLEREPKFLDSADFSAQHRPRLYWSNLPWGPYQVDDVILQDVLRRRCNRQALVKKIMTVTTRSNSLNQSIDATILYMDLKFASLDCNDI